MAEKNGTLLESGTNELEIVEFCIQNETRVAVSSMEEGVQEVARGSEEAAKSGKALDVSLDQINEVTAQINQIATAAEEQTATTREISNNVHLINEAVSGSSRGVQELSMAAGTCPAWQKTSKGWLLITGSNINQKTQEFPWGTR